MKDKRSKKMVFLAYCLLNQNAKVQGLAGYAGAFEPLVRTLLRSGVGLVQLPCPEAICLGLKRPLGTDTVEQYHTPKYRSVCCRMAEAAVNEMRAYRQAGYRVLAVLGVEGSPSCSVERAPRLVNGERRLVRGSGLFMMALRKEASGFKVAFIGIPECPAAGDLKKLWPRSRN